MLIPRRLGAPSPGASASIRTQASGVGATAISRAATSSNFAGSIDSRGSSGASRLAAMAPTSAAAKAKLASDVDAALERTRTSLLALQGVDGSYNTAFNGGPMMVALGSLMSTACSRQDPNAQWVVDYLRTAQLRDGSFAMNPGDEPSAQATQLVALALEMIAKYEPGLAKDALAVSRKARQYSRQDPPNNGNLYGFLANVLNDLIAGTDYVKGMPMGLIMEARQGLHERVAVEPREGLRRRGDAALQSASGPQRRHRVGLHDGERHQHSGGPERSEGVPRCGRQLGLDGVRHRFSVHRAQRLPPGRPRNRARFGFHQRSTRGRSQSVDTRRRLGHRARWHDDPGAQQQRRQQSR